MALTPGTRIGPYEVLSALGAGGMGEVYRARDTRLGRDVALKILPDAAALDAERLARLTREAQVLASLNHPNIAAIYGVEDQALVLELVEGPTLADRIAEVSHAGSTGPCLPVDEALAIARQIADALDEAHQRGVVHRDLKPANIKVRDDGSVKVLDFGLAKLVSAGTSGPAANDQARSQSPTLLSPTMMTGVGMILGTAPYMSPEQARGKEVDARADVWAFGCVLYEMLTGTRAFPGEDITETIAVIVKGEPDWRRLPAALPPAVRVYLARCLAKQPRERVGSIADVRLAIEGAFDVAPAGSPTAGTHVGRPRRSMVLAAGLALAAIVAAAALAWTLKPASEAPTAPVRRFAVSAGSAALAVATNNRDLAMTPDGTRIVYFAGQGTNRQIHVRALDSLTSVELHVADRFFEPFVSPDGKWIGYNDESDYTLRKLAFTGGSPVSIASVGREIVGATWGPDDTIVFATNEGGTGLWRVPAGGGGTPTVLTTPDKARGEVAHGWPEFLPGGTTLVFTIRSGENSGEFEIAGLDLGTGQQKRLGVAGTSPRFSATGHLVYSVGSALHAVRFDPARLEVLGEAAPVAEGVLVKASGGASFAVSHDGTLVYVSGGTFGGGVGRRLVLSDRKGGRKVLNVPERAYTIPRFSPDGRRLALDVRDQQGDIWIWDLERETLTRLTFDPGTDQVPVWTPDGRRLALTSARRGPANLYWQSADGTGSAERLTQSSDAQVPLMFTPDASRLLFRKDGAPTGEDLFLLAMDGRQATPLLQSRFNERNAAISPDGRWLAYQSNESGPYEIYVRPFPAIDTGRWQVSSGGGIMPTWAGRELFYVAADGALVSTTVAAGASIAFSKPQMVAPAGFFIAPTSRSYDVSADGTRILVIDATATAGGTQSNMVVVLNWGQEVRRLLPAR